MRLSPNPKTNLKTILNPNLSPIPNPYPNPNIISGASIQCFNHEAVCFIEKTRGKVEKGALCLKAQYQARSQDFWATRAVPTTMWAQARISQKAEIITFDQVAFIFKPSE